MTMMTLTAFACQMLVFEKVINLVQHKQYLVKEDLRNSKKKLIQKYWKLFKVIEEKHVAPYFQIIKLVFKLLTLYLLKICLVFKKKLFQTIFCRVKFFFMYYNPNIETIAYFGLMFKETVFHLLFFYFLQYYWQLFCDLLPFSFTLFSSLFQFKCAVHFIFFTSPHLHTFDRNKIENSQIFIRVSLNKTYQVHCECV